MRTIGKHFRGGMDTYRDVCDVCGVPFYSDQLTRKASTGRLVCKRHARGMDEVECEQANLSARTQPRVYERK